MQLCRECGDSRAAPLPRCPACGSPRAISHPELDRLTIAHLDCDAFYATVEKRDRPEVRDQPVIVGGGRRGVVTACCYIARTYGVRSAMPMFKALKACPDAAVIKPDMAKYAAVGQQVRELMRATTPLVEPVSIDEAFLDLSGTEALHGGSAARTLALLARRIEAEIGITISIGLSYNKFLAKIASDLDKPRGFAVIGREDATAFLSKQSVGLIAGVGNAMRAKLAADGILGIADLQARRLIDLERRYGAMGGRLWHFARGEDDRAVSPDRAMKSISAETTFETDLAATEALEAKLWQLSEKVARRMKRAEKGGSLVTLKLKTADFRIVTRSHSLAAPTQLAETLFRVGAEMLRREIGPRYRLIGIGADKLCDAALADPPDLFDPTAEKRRKVEAALDAVRDKLGAAAISKGRGFVPRS